VDWVRIGLEEIKGTGVRSGWDRMAKVRALLGRERGTWDAIVFDAQGQGINGSRVKRWMKGRYQAALIACVVRLAREQGIPLAALDYCDDETVHPVNLPLLRACTLYFKRELGVDPWRSLESFQGGVERPPTMAFRLDSEHQQWVKKFRPVSLGMANREEAILEWVSGNAAANWQRPYDVMYLGSDSCRPFRELVREQLREADGLRVFAPDESVPFEEYIQIVRDSYLCLSPPGFGWDCFRHYEIGYLESIPVTMAPYVWAHEPYLDGVDGFYYDPHQPLVPQLKEMLEKKAQFPAMAAKARKKVEDWHLSTARTDYIGGELAGAGRSPAGKKV
jgi:hypothetical protein